MFQKPPKVKSNLYSKDKITKTNYDEDENKENSVIKYIKVNSSRREFGKDIVNIRRSINIGSTIDSVKKQSLSKDSINRNDGYNTKQSSATYVNCNTKKEKSAIPECNSSKSKSINQLKVPNRKALDKKIIETLISQKSSSSRSVNVHSESNNNNNKSSNSNRASNINRKRNIPNTNLTIGYSLSQSRKALTSANPIKDINQECKRETSQFEYEEKERQPLVPERQPKNIVNYPITFIQEPYTHIFLNQTNEKQKHKHKQKNDTLLYFNDLPLNNPQYPSVYINTIYHNLLLEEFSLINTQKAIFDYMKFQTEINEQMRSILTDWLIDVHLKFKFSEETLYMTMNIIDRYLSIQNVTKGKLQLVGITALMIACKHEEIDLPKVKDFIYITDNAYSKDELFKMEYQILSKLQFNFLIPSPLKFYEILSTGFKFSNQQMLLGNYLMETFLIDINILKYKSSIIACACLYIVMKFSKMPNYACSYDKKYHTFNEDDITHYNVKECAKDICLFVDKISRTQYSSTQKKYSKKEYEEVAMLILGK